MKHQSFCGRMCNVDAEVHFTKFSHVKLKPWAIFLEFVLEDRSKRIRNLYNASSKFQLQKLNASMLIFQVVKRDGKYIFAALHCSRVTRLRFLKMIEAISILSKIKVK